MDDEEFLKRARALKEKWAALMVEAKGKQARFETVMAEAVAMGLKGRESHYYGEPRFIDDARGAAYSEIRELLDTYLWGGDV